MAKPPTPCLRCGCPGGSIAALVEITVQEQEHRRSPWLRRIALAIGLLLAVWLLAWLAVPPLLKSQAEQRLSALLGRQVRVGGVDFAPWALSITVRDLSIAGPGDGNGPEQLRVARLHADVSASSLWRRAPVVEALQIDAPALRLTRLPDGKLDIDDMLARLRPAPDAPPSEPARFALYNLRLTDGRLHVDDLAAGVQHNVQALQLGLPFLSNLPADVAVTVEPRLAFRLDGSPFDSGAQLLPFGPARHGSLRLSVDDVDLARWAPYLPASMPLRPGSGLLSADLVAQFGMGEQQQPQLKLQGEATLRGVEWLPAAGGTPLAGWKLLHVTLDDVQPLARRVVLGELSVEGLQLDVARDAAGRIDWQTLTGGTKTAAVPASEPAAGTPPAAPWQLSLKSLRLADAQVNWRDATTAPAAALALNGLQLTAGPLDTAAAAPVPLQWSAQLGPIGQARSALFKGEGQAGPGAVALSLELQDLDAAWLAPYVAQQLALPLAGKASAKLRLDWAAGDQPRLLADIGGLQLTDLRLGADGAGAAPAAWRSVSVTDGRIDLLGRSARIGTLAIDQPQLDLRRAADGSLSAMAWLRSAPAAATQPAADTAKPAPWQLQLQNLQLTGGRLRWADAVPPAGVALRLADLKLNASGLRWPADAQAALARLTLSTQVADDRPPREGRQPAPAGRIEWTGQANPQPLAAKGQLRVERLPVHALAPYVQTGLQLVLAHADAGWRGQVAVQQRSAGLEVDAQGDALLSDVQVQALPAARGGEGDDLLNWQALQLTGLKLRSAPGAAPSLEIVGATLSDFYSRLVITEEGHFNLRDVAPPRVPAAGASAPAAAASAPEAEPAGPGAQISVGRTKLVRGRIDFTDRFVKPNYSAALSDLTGTLGAFRTGSADKAALSLQGRVAGTGLLDINGELNPVARPLALNIRAKATDIELAPFSPYSGRYAGYAIERGKLSMDVAYKIEPDGRLDASNRLVLNQLTFGDRVESAEATKLPVTLAIALLKDRNGVIDLDLPVSGSLNDPQFTVFGLVWKILGNLLVKAVTAPFSLLTGGGGSDSSTIEFVPGTDRLAATGEASLGKVAQALADRPGLNLTVSGAVDAQVEQPAIRDALLEARLLAEHQRRVGRGATPAPPPTAAEREALLRRLYADTPLPDKPRNLVGLAKELPPADMEARLKAALPVTDDGVRDLAMRRGAAVRDALLARGLPSERLFLAAPKLRSEAAAADSAPGPMPGAQLVLSTR